MLIRIIAIIICNLLLYTIKINNSLYYSIATINCTLICWDLFCYEMNPYSTHKVVNLFMLIFFVFANSIQFADSSIVTSISINFSSYDYCIMQMSLLIIIVIFNTLYKHYYRNTQISYFKWKLCLRSHNKEAVLILLCLSCFLLVIVSLDGNLEKLFFRGFYGDTYDESMSTNVINDLIIEKFIRVIPCVGFIISLLSRMTKKTKFILFIIFLFDLFPTGIARNAVAMYWLPVFLFIFRNFFKRKHLFIAAMLFGILIVFPFFDNFRYYDGSITLKFDLNYLNSMNFDASQEYMSVIKKDLITYGHQLLGVIFFFVPRSIWSSKPDGSGAYLASFDGSFFNISMPFWGEGYINFGWFGVFIFTIILAYYCAKLDKLYWNFDNPYNNPFSGIYYIILGALLFILRGDLMSSIAYTASAVICYIVILRLIYKLTT